MRDGFRCPCEIRDVTTLTLEATMFLAAKVQMISGMVVGALAVTVAKQIYKQRKAHKNSSMPANPPQK